jgi:hypothetical protein
VIKHKVIFDKVSNLLDLAFMVIKAFEATNWQKYPVNAFQHWPRNTQFNGRSLVEVGGGNPFYTLAKVILSCLVGRI